MVFAVGYAARPGGGLILGRLGDRIGRKPALMISIAAIGVSTSAIGLLPIVFANHSIKRCLMGMGLAEGKSHVDIELR